MIKGFVLAVIVSMALIGCGTERQILDEISDRNPSYENFSQCLIPENTRVLSDLGEVNVSFDMPCLQIQTAFEKLRLPFDEVIGTEVAGHLKVIDIVIDEQDANTYYLLVGEAEDTSHRLTEYFSFYIKVNSNQVKRYQVGLNYDFDVSVVETAFGNIEIGGEVVAIYRDIIAVIN